MANTKRNSMDKKKRAASAPARRSSGRKGGFFMDTAADMVLPHGLNAGLATLGLVGLNDYVAKPRRGRKQRGGENENSGNENSGMFANMFGNNNAPANNALRTTPLVPTTMLNSFRVSVTSVPVSPPITPIRRITTTRRTIM